MSKEEEARIRDGLLQELYAGVLRVRLARSQSSAGAGGRAAFSGAEAVAAGLAANLQELDLVALPHRGAMALRVLRGAAATEQSVSPARDLRAGLLTLPQTEGAAAALVLGASASAMHGAAETVVVALLPPSAELGPAAAPATRVRAGGFKPPETWAGLASHAARNALPLLFVSDGTAEVASPGPDQLPPALPTIPVDRDDALAVYRVAFECMGRARLGGGPSHLACVPFRTRGRKPAAPDALMRLENTLRARGAFGASWRNGLERRLIRELSGA